MSDDQPQTNPVTTDGFASRSEEAAVRLMRAAALIQVRSARLLKHYGLSPVTHDILRVLRGAGGVLPARDVARRISTASPDLTRLLQRLEKIGWVERGRDTADGRLVIVRLTDAGGGVLDQVAGPMASFYKQVMGRLKKGDRKALVAVLRQIEGQSETRA